MDVRRTLRPGAWTYRAKVPLLIASVCVATALAVSFAIAVSARHWLRQDLIDHAAAVAQSLARGLIIPLAHDDVWEAFEAVRSVASVEGGPSTCDVVVLGRDGRIFVSSDPLRFPVGSPSTVLTAPLQNALRLTGAPGAVALGEVTTAENTFSTVDVPLLSDDRELVGTLLMSYSHAIFAKRYRETVATLAEITAALVAILIPLGWWLGHRLTNPLSRVTDALYRLGTEAARKSSAVSVVPANAFASSEAPSNELDRLEHSLAHLQQQLNEREQLERQFLAADRLAAIGRLTSSVAHEINNPLAGMLNALSNLRVDPTFLSQTVALLTRGIEQIRQTLSALLIETKTRTRPLSPSDIGDLRLLVQTQARNKRLHLDWTYPIATELPLPAAPVRQVILNLLLNAIQAAESLVSFSASATDAELTLSIANDGREFPAALRQRPFEPLVDGEGQGHGLGLWASHQLVTSLGGRINVTSASGNTVFVVHLPFDRLAVSTDPALLASEVN